MKIALWALMMHQASATVLEPCFGVMNTTLTPALNCFLSGNTTKECAALIDNRYLNAIFSLTRHGNDFFAVSTDPTSTEACVFARINTPFQVIRTCFPNVHQILDHNITMLPPIRLANIFKKLQDGRSMVYMGMIPTWPWEIPCAFIHEMAAPAISKNQVGIVIDSPNDKVTQIYFDIMNPTAAKIIKDGTNPLGYIPKKLHTMVHVFDPNSKVSISHA